MKKLAFIYLFIFFSCLFAEPISFLDWENLDRYQDKIVEIKGFLYEKESQSILASEPNLKSCCLKQKRLIYLNDLLKVPSTKHALKLQGKLVISDQMTEGEKLSRRVYLDQSKVIEESSKYNLLIVLTLTFSLIMITSLFKKMIGKLS